jgi:hypothetical protein
MALRHALLALMIALALEPAGGFSLACCPPGSARLAFARAARPSMPAGGARMFFSTPDVGNLLFAQGDQRFFNPVWFPYFARPTHVEEVAPAQGAQPWAAFLGARLGSAPRSTGMWMFEQVVCTHALARGTHASFVVLMRYPQTRTRVSSASASASAENLRAGQPIGFLNITVNIRMTVIKLRDDSLLVYNPIAPTGECLRELERLGPVRHIVLGSTALEHKVFCRAFADKFPDASIYVPPGIFNLIPGRVDLSPPGLGLFVDLLRPLKIDGYLTKNFKATTFNGVEYPASPVPSWADELSHEPLMFDAPPIASACEVAMFHKRTRCVCLV